MSSWFDAPELAPWLPEIERRRRIIDQARAGIAATDGSLHDFCFANGIHFYGLQRQQADRAQKGGFWFREWAPTARAASLVGDFNGWDADAHPCARDEAGVFSVFVPDPADGVPALPLGTGYKIALRVQGDGGDWVFRVPAWARLTRQDPLTGDVCAVVVGEIEGFAWRHARPAAPPSLRIYEAHVGIGSEEAAVATWGEFRRCVLPHVVALGYNALLLMAVHQHGYYASFGYQVTSFFAPSSRFGPPSELQALIDEAHGHGVIVLMDLVHSHASCNTREGLGGLGATDGDDSPFFARGAAGKHAVWGTRLFDYGRVEVLRFLLANICWFATAYRFDGFRFDAVSTALFRHRCLGGRGSFHGAMAEYFGAHADVDVAAVAYLSLANLLCHSGGGDPRSNGHGLGTPPLLTIAEEYTGMPGLCAPLEAGGIGFDFRQALNIPPMWVRLLPDSGRLPIGQIVATLCEGRREERRLSYVECHDQSMVGDQTLAQRLMGARLHDGMSTLLPPCPVVERGIALHKLSRLLTCALSGHAYLTFMGNEFGHPDWIDLPREGNGHSFERARRLWS